MEISCTFKPESYKHIHGTYYIRDADKKQYDNEVFDMPAIQLICAKNDFAACQIVIEADRACSLSIGKEAYFSAADIRENLRITLRGIALEWSLQHIGAVTDDDGLKKDDILLNDENIEVGACKPACIWLEIKVPESAKAGLYNGEVCVYHHRMFEPEKLIKAMPFCVEVYDVVLTNPRDGSFYLDLWQHNSNIARKHDVLLWSDEHFAVMDAYMKTLADLGQRAITVVACEIPWTGQLCFREKEYVSDLFEYSMARIVKNIRGEYKFDFSVIKRYVEMCMRHGIDKEIEVFGLCNIWASDDKEYSFTPEGYPDLVRLRYLDEADGAYKYMDNAADIARYIAALETFFKDAGWIDIVRIAADEPSDLAKYQASVDAVRRVAPSFQYKAAVGHAEFMREFSDSVSDFVPVFSLAAEAMETVEALMRGGKHRMLWYVCCMPHIPNTYLSSHLLEARSIGWFTAFLGMHGFLRWSYTTWPEKPREQLSYRAPSWPCGDMCLVYPGNHGAPLLSLRYKALLRGICDFELIRQMADSGGEAVLAKAYQTLIKVQSPADISPIEEKQAQDIISLDYADYDAVKSAMLAFLAGREKNM